MKTFTGFFGGLLQQGFSQQEGQRALAPSPRVFRDVYERLGSSDQPWLVFIDQFEEIFTRARR